MVITFPSNHHYVTGYEQFNVLFCKWLHPFSVCHSFSKCLVWITIWRDLFSSVRETTLSLSAKNCSEKQKNSTWFHSKDPWQNVSKGFRRSLIAGRYWEEKKIFKRSLRGKRTEKAYLVILISHFFPWSWKLWKNEDLNSLPFPPSLLGAKGGITAVVKAGQKINRPWRSACDPREGDWLKLNFYGNFYYSGRA